MCGAIRWKVHASDSTKHWLTWTAIAGVGLGLRMLWELILEVPSTTVLNKKIQERKVQMKQGVARPPQTQEQMIINEEAWDLSYQQQSDTRERNRRVSHFLSLLDALLMSWLMGDFPRRNLGSTKRCLAYTGRI